jgi:DHA1 family bicyclomycin/chloramphenicol resistance-like MFS transporter
MVFSFLNILLLKKYEARQILRVGLFIQLIAGVVLATAVRLPEPSLWLVFAAIVVFVGSLGLVFGNGTATILNSKPELAGSANATIGIARFVISFIIGSVMAVFHTGDLIPFGTVLLLCSFSGNLLFLYAFKMKA